MITTWSRINIPASVGELKNKTKWEIVQYLASSRPISYDLDRMGNFVTKCWLQDNTTPTQYTITEGEVIEGSLSVQLAGRSDIINKVDITFESRFPQLCERRDAYVWQHAGVCSTSPFPTIQMIEDAARATGAKLVHIDTDPVFPSGEYSCYPGGEIMDMVFQYLDADRWLVASSARINLLRRFTRDVKRTASITVKSPTSIINVGEMVEKESDAIDYTAFDADAWVNDLNKEPFINHSSGNSAGTFYYNVDQELNQQVNYAIEFLIDKAKVLILQSHRKNIITLSVPYEAFPDLDRNDFVYVNVVQPYTGYPRNGYNKVRAKGQVLNCVENFDVDTGSAVKTLTIAVSRLNALGIPTETTTDTVAPDQTVTTTDTTVEGAYQLLNWFKNGTPEQQPTDTSYGLIASIPGISDKPILDSKTGLPTGNYVPIFSNADEFRIPTMDIDTSEQSQIDTTFSGNYDLLVPDNLLEVEL